MHGLASIDQGREFDWGRTSNDYAAYRPGYPVSFFRRLAALGIGVPEQRLLDLGTGTGALARLFAARGCEVTGLDIAPKLLAAGRRLAAEQGAAVEFIEAPAENTGLPSRAFDIVTAGQAWIYFDLNRVIPEVLRLLMPGGGLMTCHQCWLPRHDEIARQTEELVLQFNPGWSGADYSGDIPPQPEWSRDAFRVRAMFYYDEPIPFTRDSWRGRIRASRGIGASLPAGEVERFDREHAALLERAAPENFSILHRIDMHFFEPK